MAGATDYNDSAGATALSDYVDTAIQHGRGTETGDSDVANAAYHRHAELLLQDFPKEKRRLLIPLLDHKNQSVRLFAALDTYCLDPERSERVLEAVSNQPGLVGFSAEMTLRELKSGRLIPP